MTTLEISKLYSNGTKVRTCHGIKTIDERDGHIIKHKKYTVMVDQIVINLRALNQECRDKIAKILDDQLNAVSDDTNEMALSKLKSFTE